MATRRTHSPKMRTPSERTVLPAKPAPNRALPKEQKASGGKELPTQIPSKPKAMVKKTRSGGQGRIDDYAH